MPGPGPHMMYALATGTGLTHISRGRFTPHHSIFYAANAFLGPDLGSFTEWITSFSPDGGNLRRFGSFSMEIIHHPVYYIFLLGLPLSFLYTSLSRFLFQKGFLDTLSGVPLSRKQCFFLVAAGSLSHFFLDHLFESKAWRIQHNKIKPIIETYLGSSKLLLHLVCSSIIFEKPPTTSSWRRGRSWSSGVPCHLLLSSSWFLLPFNEPKRVWQ